MQILAIEVSVELAAKLGLTKQEYLKVQELLENEPSFLELLTFSVMWSEQYSKKNAFHWLKTLPVEAKEVNNYLTFPHYNTIKLDGNLEVGIQVSTSGSELSVAPEFGIQKTLSDNLGAMWSKGMQVIGIGHTMILGQDSYIKNELQLDPLMHQASAYSRVLEIPTIGFNTGLHKSFKQSPGYHAFSIGIRSEQKEEEKPNYEEKTIYLVYPSPSYFPPKETDSFIEGLVEELSQDAKLNSLENAHDLQILRGLWTDWCNSSQMLSGQFLDANGLIPGLVALLNKLEQGARIDLAEWSKQIETSILLMNQASGFLAILEEEPDLSYLSDQWNISAIPIGKITPQFELSFHFQENEQGSLNIQHLLPGTGAPVYQREIKKPSQKDSNTRFQIKKAQTPGKPQNTAKKLWSKSIFQLLERYKNQFDRSIGGRLISDIKPSDAAILSLPEHDQVLAFSMVGNASYLSVDPYNGAMIAIGRATRSLTCSGAHAKGVAIGLHFGNPYDPQTYWCFMQCIRGISEASRRFHLPILHQDVSFDNQYITKDGAEDVEPFVSVAVIGHLKSSFDQIGLGFEQSGDIIYMLGTPNNDVNSSEYLRTIHDKQKTICPEFDLDEEFHIQYHLKKIFRKELIVSAHSIKEGGLFVSLIEAASIFEYGFEIELDPNFRKDAYLFGEGQNRVIISVRLEREDELVNYLNTQNVPFTRIGEVIPDDILIDKTSFGTIQDWKIGQTAELP